MDGLWERLYGTFCWNTEREPENRKELLAEYLAMCEKIEPVFGTEFLDRLSELKRELDQGDDLADFRQGMRLGARLALELFRPA